MNPPRLSRWRVLAVWCLACGLGLYVYLLWRVLGVSATRLLALGVRVAARLGCTEIFVLDDPATLPPRLGTRSTNTAAPSTSAAPPTRSSPS